MAAIELNTFISQSLAPAVAISGIGMLILSLGNRMTSIGTRIRQLNRELPNTSHQADIDNIRLQIKNFLKRARIIRNATFLLYAALGMMVLTTFGVAFQELDMPPAPFAFSIATFLGGLLLTFIAVILEAYEIVLNLENLKLDIDLAFNNVERTHRNQS